MFFVWSLELVGEFNTSILHARFMLVGKRALYFNRKSQANFPIWGSFKNFFPKWGGFKSIYPRGHFWTWLHAWCKQTASGTGGFAAADWTRHWQQRYAQVWLEIAISNGDMRQQRESPVWLASSLHVGLRARLVSAQAMQRVQLQQWTRQSGLRDQLHRNRQAGWRFPLFHLTII